MEEKKQFILTLVFIFIFFFFDNNKFIATTENEAKQIIVEKMGNWDSTGIFFKYQ